ncbi:MAG: VapC toxin family PIN domain ribonuclease [Rhodospirillales bacterium CG15_BIG_FIL_POST_REV_8_21_14_020_66_15]|nr:MAG: VapC toxin family PIN domain ribonuclease [Rhodospirillales bacterium CG15_BIG_FIL_POST_REV_8_21_14_020_66_15]
MIVLDTNVLSALMRSEPDPVAVAWLDDQPPESIWTTAITVFEIRFGLEILENGRRRRSLEDAFAKALEEDLEGRILSFDQTAAEAAAAIAAERRRAGGPVEIRDVEIAGIAVARKATLATRNTRHFEGAGISLIDPWGD